MESTNSEAPIYSTFGDDPDLGELVEMFVDEMPDRIQTFINAFNSGDQTALMRAAHQMKGSAGSYGFDDLTPASAALEASIRSEQSMDQIQSLMNELVDMCRRIRAGTP